MRSIRDIVMSEALVDHEKKVSQAITRAEVRGILKLCRSMRHRITYVCLAKALGMFSGGTELSKILGEIMMEDLQSSDPVLSSLVVKTATGMPGPGYFWMATHFCGIASDQASSDEYWMMNMKNLGLVVNKQDPATGLIFRSVDHTQADDVVETLSAAV